MISSGRDGTLRLWDGGTGHQVDNRRCAGEYACALAVSPDGQELFAGCNDGIVRAFELTSGRELRKYEGHAGTVDAIALTPDGGTLVSGGTDGSVRLWHPRTGDQITTLRGHAFVQAVGGTPGWRVGHLRR